MTISPNAVASMRLLSIRGVGAAKLRKIGQLSTQAGRSLDAAINDEPLLSRVLNEQQLDQLRASEPPDLEELEREGIGAISVFDESYPRRLSARLNDGAPPLLFVRGRLEILEQPSVGFCGSRKASEKGLCVATDCAEQLAQDRINVVSGYAAGVDLHAHKAALAAGGTTTLVLAEGIQSFRIKRDLREVWDWDRACVVSEFLPSAKWSVGNAMQRNRTICGLSNAMILIEARSSGGSIAAGNACLELGVPLFAPVYQGMPESATGNRILLTQGAREIRKGRQTNRALLSELVSCVNANPDGPSTANAPQLALFAGNS
ncbi:MAG: DNA-binding protein [Deltaproteobacteria bacterium]|nr:MAG: DNA-binding protein [Deltaproteobacteria bacterium]